MSLFVSGRIKLCFALVILADRSKGLRDVRRLKGVEQTHLGSWGALGPIVSALPASQFSSRAVLGDPNTDLFCQHPVGFEKEATGPILRERSISASFLGLILNPVTAYQLLYRTTAINGSAIATLTTIFKPLIAKTDRFISFQMAYDSSALPLGTPQTDLISSVEMLVVEAYLVLGYIVSSPEYEGPDAAFGAGRLKGMGTLDSIRAVSKYYERLVLDSYNPMAVGVKYSGGALATGWAASLQPSYAPEINIKGWVQGGTSANLTGTVLFIDNTAFSEFFLTAMAGLTKPSAYGAELTDFINSILTPEGREKANFAAENCAVKDLLSFHEISLFSTD
ncbi:hypothetical protein N7476_004820 [Penicillium atrosanguineum]|uniref:Uncharacterized protein n=1 Tax=Penicillium atrosanguineum TaxID=1132637 RepID=A0A9W9U5J4_9EURO|nr:hypothetical protein N7476_004820 [Penicillium atrosanguineum]